MNTYIIGYIEFMEDITVESTVQIALNGNVYDACVKQADYSCDPGKAWLDLLVGENKRVVNELIMAGNNITIRIGERDIPFLVETTEHD